MTTAVGDNTGRQLDFSGDSIQLTTRKGADLLWLHRFTDEDDDPIDISTWEFERTLNGNLQNGDPAIAEVSSGAVRNGTSDGTGVLRDAQGAPITWHEVASGGGEGPATTEEITVPAGQPLTVAIDIVKIDTRTQSTIMTTNLDIDQARLTIGGTQQNQTRTLELFFPTGMRPAIPDDRFFHIITGAQTFFFTSADISLDPMNTDIWVVNIEATINPQDGTDYVAFQDTNMGNGYTLQQRDTSFMYRDAIQCYFKTEELTNVNPSAGRNNQAGFEIEAIIPVPALRDSLGQVISGTSRNVVQVVAAGQLNLFSDVYTATTNQ